MDYSKIQGKPIELVEFFAEKFQQRIAALRDDESASEDVLIGIDRSINAIEDYVEELRQDFARVEAAK